MLPYNFGNIGGNRVTFNDHLGEPNGDIDAYKFTTDGVPRKLMLAVRDQKGAELVNSKVTVGLFDANNSPVSYKVVNGIIEANLKPNSQYYIKMNAQPGVGTNYQLVTNLLAQSSSLQVPPGRHEYNVNISTHDVQGNKLHNSYNFKLENTGTLNWAIRDTTLKQGDFEFTLYKDGRQWGNTLKPQINEPLQFTDLPPGNYQVKVDVTNSSKNGGSYKTVFNLDEASQTLAQASNLGKLTDQEGRLIANDHVGMPTNDLDYYKFSTDSNQRLLRFAVRHPSGNGSLPLEGNVEFVLYDKNGKELKPPVNSANKEAIYGEYDLEANSEYYVRVKAHSGNLGNYHLVLNGEVKRTVKPDPKPPDDGGSAWQHPLPGYPVTSEFGWRDESSWGGDNWHNGIDFGTYGTTPSVKAAKSGTVFFAGWNTEGYGNLIILDHGDGTRSYYAHLSKISVSKNQTVSGGSHIGNVGATGTAFGIDPEHLHFEIRVSPYKYKHNSKNPRNYIL
jgi:murein DD-endopeptidase MepM/ murein hydrolase activator NlpD